MSNDISNNKLSDSARTNARTVRPGMFFRHFKNNNGMMRKQLHDRGPLSKWLTKLYILCQTTKVSVFLKFWLWRKVLQKLVILCNFVC